MFDDIMKNVQKELQEQVHKGKKSATWQKVKIIFSESNRRRATSNGPTNRTAREPACRVQGRPDGTQYESYTRLSLTF